MPVHNEDLAAAFDEMADLLALKADNPFRINAYRRASQVVRALPEEKQSKIAAGFDPDTLPSKAHNVHVRRLAMARGLKMNEYGSFAVASWCARLP